MSKFIHGTMNRPEFMNHFRGRSAIPMLEKIERDSGKALHYVSYTVDSLGIMELKVFGPEIEGGRYDERE